MGRLKVIKTKKGVQVDGEISIYEYQEENVFYCVSPELDLVGYGNTLVEAKESFEFLLKELFEYTMSKGNLDDELKRLGWTKNKSPEYTAPTPVELTHSELFTELLSRNSFSKHTQQVAFC